MNILNIKFCLIIIIISLSGCGGLVNNLYTNPYTVIKDLTPHGNKVKRSGKDSFPENGMSIVSLNFIGGKEEYKAAAVDTLWRKVNDDGTFSKRISLTYVNPFKKGRLESMIEPGTYFLDGFRYINNNNSIRVGAFLELMGVNTQKGWDLSNKKPLWFSFTVEKGKEVYIPDVLVSGRCLNGSNSCGGDSFELTMKIDESYSKKLENYQIGYKVKK